MLSKLANILSLLSTVDGPWWPGVRRCAPTQWGGMVKPRGLLKLHDGLAQTSRYTPHQSEREKQRRISQGLAGRARS